MRVLVTGGTGFVGSHTTQALLAAGHEVRLLVRDPARIAPALEPLGLDGAADHVVGDVTDPAAVDRALEGCDAVLHAASVYALGRRTDEMARTNVRSTELVLGTAHRLGLDPIVHVSSIVALLPAQGPGPLTADAPVGRPAGPYARTKAAAEVVARRLQDEGAPVVVVQPGAVWGPHDPHLGENARLALDLVRHRLPAMPPGPMWCVDVRDLGAVHAAVVEPGRGPRRYLAVAEDLPFPGVVAALREATGRRLPVATVPAGLARALIGRRSRVPAALEAPWLAAQGARTDARATSEALGVRFRAAAESIRDTAAWLQETGHLRAR